MKKLKFRLPVKMADAFTDFSIEQGLTVLLSYAIGGGFFDYDLYVTVLVEETKAPEVEKHIKWGKFIINS